MRSAYFAGEGKGAKKNPVFLLCRSFLIWSFLKKAGRTAGIK